MILSFWDNLEKYTNDINQFISKKADEPFFWLFIFIILFLIAIITISKLSNK